MSKALRDYPKCPVCKKNLLVLNVEMNEGKITTWNCKKCELQIKYVYVNDIKTKDSVQSVMVTVGNISLTYPTTATMQDMIRITTCVNVLAGKHDKKDDVE